MASLLELLGQTWPARMAQSAWSAAKLPGDVYAGRTDPLSEEGIGRAADLAGMVMGGTYAGAPAGAMGAGAVKPIRAYHGSPHDFDRFDLSRIGTGEGAQAYGHGLYFAENPATAQAYRDALEGKHLIQANDANSWALGMLKAHGNNADRAIADIRGRLTKAEDADSLAHSPQMAEKLRTAIGIIENEGVKRGKMYEVNINAAPEQFLDWDKPLAQMSPQVKQALESLGVRGEAGAGADLYHAKTGWFGGRPETSEAFREAGIPGIKYLDQGSRGVPAAVSQAKTSLVAIEDLLKQFPGDAQLLKERDAFRAASEQRPSSNYVLFRDDIIDIVKKYGLAGGAAILGMSENEAKAAMDDKPKTQIGRQSYGE